MKKKIGVGFNSLCSGCSDNGKFTIFAENSVL